MTQFTTQVAPFAIFPPQLYTINTKIIFRNQQNETTVTCLPNDTGLPMCFVMMNFDLSAYKS